MKHNEDHSLSAQDQLRSLRRGIERAAGFSLFFAICNSGRDLRTLIATLDESSTCKAEKFKLDPGGADPLTQLVEGGCGKRQGPLMIIGLDGLMEHSDIRPQIITLLNIQRDEWPKRINRPIILWIPEHAFKVLSLEAPDFVDWRSDTFFFSMPNISELVPLHPDPWCDGNDGRMSLENRRLRIEELRGRIRMHESSDNYASNQIVANWKLELASHLRMLGSYADAHSLLKQVIDSKVSLNPRITARAKHLLGNILVHRRQIGKARQIFNELRDIHSKNRDLNGLAATLGSLGMVEEFAGDFDKASVYYKKALQIFEELQDQHGIATSYTNLSDIAREHGDRVLAMQYLTKSLEINNQLGNKDRMASDNASIAGMLIEDDRHDQAEALLMDSVEKHEELGCVDGLMSDHTMLGILYAEQGNVPNALKHFEKVRDLAVSSGFYHSIRSAEENIAKVHISAGHLTSAIDAMERAIAHVEPTISTVDAAAMYHRAAMLYAELGNSEMAWDKAKRANKLFKASKVSPLFVENLFLLAMFEKLRGRDAYAESLIRKAINVSSALSPSTTPRAVVVEELIAEFHRFLDKYSDAN